MGGYLLGLAMERPSTAAESFAISEHEFDRFDCVFTSVGEDKFARDNALPFIPGTTSIAFGKWGIYPKSKGVSMAISSDRDTEGRLLRQVAQMRFSPTRS